MPRTLLQLLSGPVLVATAGVARAAPLPAGLATALGAGIASVDNTATQVGPKKPK